MPKIDLREKMAKIDELWSPKIVAELNGQHVKLVKVAGEFLWHHHRDEDELFLVLDGELTIQMPDGDVRLRAGELFVVPRGVEHRPVAERETHVLLLEPASTVNTGSAGGGRTVEAEWI